MMCMFRWLRFYTNGVGKYYEFRNTRPLTGYYSIEKPACSIAKESPVETDIDFELGDFYT